MKKTCFLYVAACLIAGNISAQVIRTVAGTGIDGFEGDGKLAHQAQLNAPNDVAIDKFGNLYIADWYNARIRKVAPGGAITTIAGTGKTGYSGDGGPATAAELNYPNRVAVDTNGNVYIADVFNSCVRKIDDKGVITTFMGVRANRYVPDNDLSTLPSLSYPSGIAADKAGNVYIADRVNSVIFKVNSEGVVSTLAGNGYAGFSGDNGPATAAQLNSPNGLAVDDSGVVYFTNTDNRIRKINKDGIISTIGGNGIAGYTGDGGMATAGEFNNPSGIVTDTSGNVYIADLDNARIRKIGRDGMLTTIAGSNKEGYSGDNGPALAAQLNNPNGLALDKWNNLYIADNINNRIRIVTPPAKRSVPRKEESTVKTISCGRFNIGIESNTQNMTPGYGGPSYGLPSYSQSMPSTSGNETTSGATTTGTFHSPTIVSTHSNTTTTVHAPAGSKRVAN